MQAPKVPTFCFKSAASAQFTDRPTLRQVASEELLKVLLARMPLLASVTPPLPSAEPLILESPDPNRSVWYPEPFVDRVLQALLDPHSLSVAPIEGRHHNIGLTAAYRFPGAKNELESRQLDDLSSDLNALVERLPECFCKAQLDYWRAPGSAGVSRDRWLQLLLKQALLRSLPLQSLDEQEQACVRGLIRGGDHQPQAFFVEASLAQGDQRFDEILCHLLIMGEWDDREVVLWCDPCGLLRSFASLADFGQALRDELAQRYRFEGMTWRRCPVEGNAFAMQVSILLESLFDRIHRLHYSQLNDLAELEQRFADLSDPAVWFIDHDDDTPKAKAPPGLSMGASSDSFACCAALLQLGLEQLDANGVAALDGVQSLNEYARQKLAEQIRVQHGDTTSANDIMLDLHIARGVPGGAATGSGGGEPLEFAGSKTLAEFAIGNLSGLNGAMITRIYRRDGGELPRWLNADAARELVAKVDIGGRYPAYVANKLDQPEQRAVRVERFGREWRSALLFSTLAAKLEGKVSEAGLQCVVDFCAGQLDPNPPRMTLMPLAFKRSPHSTKRDRVRLMYVLFCAEPALVLLYRPLYRQDTVRQYASLAALLEHIQASAMLQESLLAWMEPGVRDVYDNGGFKEPHIASIGLDPYVRLETPEPASLAIEYWSNDLDNKLYTANRDFLVELADSQSVSDAENRWQLLSGFGWLLFDVVTLFVRGPVASVFWLLQMLSVRDDLQAFEQGEEFERSAAIVDVLLNLGMVLLHLHQSTSAPQKPTQLPDATAFEGPGAQQGGFAEVAVVPAQAPVPTPLQGRYLDFSWRGQQGFNWLPSERRQALLRMRSSMSLNGRVPLSAGVGEGLYDIDGRYYAALSGDAYRVALSVDGVRIVDGDGRQGPWLAFSDGAWRVDPALRLAGGMLKGGRRAGIIKRFQALVDDVAKHDSEMNDATKAFAERGDEIVALQLRTTNLEKLKAKAQETLDSLPSDGDAGPTKNMIGLYDARIAEQRFQIAQLRDRSIRHLEAAVRADNAVAPLLSNMLEPKYAGERSLAKWDEILAKRQADAKVNLIRNNDFILNELWNLADYPKLAELQAKIDRRPLTEVVHDYAAFRRRLAIVVDFQDRMLNAQEQLDVALADADADLQITGAFAEDTRTVGQLIARRRFSTVQLRFHQVLNLADLSLHLDAPSQQRVLAGWREDMTSNALRSAAEAHGDLDYSNLPVEDRITILQEAWDEYAAALLNSARILEVGGPEIEPAMIRRYRDHLEKLKLDAGRRLVDAVHEQEGVTGAGKRTAYPVASEQQRLVRNNDGQLLIGVEIEEGGKRVVEVRETFSQLILARFDWLGGEWRQRVSEPSVPTEVPVAGGQAMRVQALLDESAGIYERGRFFADHYFKGSTLAQLFDQQLDKLQQMVGDLREQSASGSLGKQLESAADDLRAEKNRLLTRLYTNTPYPTAEALRFLFNEGLLKIVSENRKPMADGSYFDEYIIRRLQSKTDTVGRPLWVAHFHMPSATAYGREFTQGHLKTWSQRRMSGRVEAGQRVHRGKVTLAEVEGIIPFL